MSPWSRLAAPTYKNTGSIARDNLASERTFLAWTRTGLGFVALGIAVERFSRFELMGFKDDNVRTRSKQSDRSEEHTSELQSHS